MTSHEASNQDWTVGRLLSWTREHFAAHGVDSPRLSAELLLAHVLGCRRIELYTHPDRAVDADHRAGFRDLVKRAAHHEPVAYLIGRREFYSLDLSVTPDVLVPRPETEALVAQALSHFEHRKGEPLHLLDLCTGSGCIAIALLVHLPEAKVVATDISKAALEVVRMNGEQHGVGDRLFAVEADGLDLPPACIPSGGFDAIVANPPYVAAEEMDLLPRSVADFEPRAALTDEADGLKLYREIAQSAAPFLRTEGVVFVEIAAGKGPAVAKVMTEYGWNHFGTWRDPNDPHDRVMGFKALANLRGCNTGDEGNSHHIALREAKSIGSI